MSIVIHSDRPPLRISPERVYFAFPSGVFSYDCVSCGAQCCRGHGYAINGERELRPQIQTHPEVRFFLDPCDALATHYHVQNFAPGCFFLTKEGRCRIQIERGFDEKPGTCRFFPFNALFRVGSHLVVVPHSQLCPLTVVEPGASRYSNHEELLRTLSAHGIDDHVQERRPIGLPDSELIRLEREIIRLAEQREVEDYAMFAAAQNAATERAVRSGAVDNVAASDDGMFQRLRRDIDGVLGAAHGASDDPQVVRLVVAMTPVLRAQMVFGEPGAQTSLVDLRTIPAFLLAVHCLAQLAARAGMEERVSYQTVMRLVSQNRPLLVLLSQLDSVLMWRSDMRVDLSFGGDRSFQMAHVHIAQALLPHVQRKAGASLGEILRAHLPAEAMPRIDFVKRLAKKLQGRVVRFDSVPLLNRVAHSPRATIQQLLIGTLAPEVAASIAARRTVRSVLD